METDTTPDTTLSEIAALVDRQRKALAEVGHPAADHLYCLVGPDGEMRLVSHKGRHVVDDTARKALSIDPVFEVDECRLEATP